MILTLHIANTLHIWNEVFSYNLKKYVLSIGYFMVWPLVLKLKRRGSDDFSNDPYHHFGGGGSYWDYFYQLDDDSDSAVQSKRHGDLMKKLHENSAPMHKESTHELE